MSLFARYPVSAGLVHGEANAIQATIKPIASVASSATEQHSKAAAAVAGTLQPPIAVAAKPVTTKASTIQQAALFAAGCIRYWGDAITTYDTGIDGLNHEYDKAASGHFGFSEPSLLEAARSGHLDTYADDLKAYRAHVSSARTALIAALTVRKNRLDETLDGEARTTAGWLGAGPTDAALVSLMQSGALAFSAVDLFPGVDFSAVDMSALMRRLKALGRQGWLVQAGNTSASLKKLLDLLREDGVAPRDYKDLLQQYWLVKACEKAGIDLSGWDPSLGTDAMKPYLIASYAYYAKLYHDNPNFQWAGMAAMIGPVFAGGMVDLQLMRRLSDIASKPLDIVPGWLLDPLVPEQLKLINVLGQMSEGEFKYFETSLLSMQKQIFTDQVPMHEAYLEMGMDGIQEMRDAGLIDDSTLTAWHNIDYGSKYGDPDLVANGNQTLLYREQHDIIGDDYDAMRNYHGPVGEAMTYVMGAVGTSGIPGTKTLAQYDPLTFGGSVEVPVPFLPNPYGSLDVKTPLPAGNISDFDTRWDLIESDTLPAFRDLMKNHPAEVEAILNADVNARIEDARIVHNLDDLIKRLSDFDIHVEIGTR